MEFQRKLYKKLINWKNESKWTTALLIEGMRRVGKSHIVELFGKNEYKSYISIDFNFISKTLIDIFDNDIYNLDVFFTNLSVFFSTTLNKK
jgi:predicted AAA+ superfamily ATPase